MDSFSTGVSLDRTNIHSIFKSISEPPRDLFLLLPKIFIKHQFFAQVIAETFPIMLKEVIIFFRIGQMKAT